ncbi:MAG: SAM-dependent methyltransferase [Gammaproteobacteria bacterium]|nr:SAM-dependent methyltransferase [Gammaproteobacteria bacterium]
MNSSSPHFRQRLRQAQQQADTLPAPSADALKISQELVARIRAEIQQTGGCISFARYMEMALYEPGLGYYSAGSRKFGKEGDFITAPETSPLFSCTLARAIQPALDELSEKTILEVGAGSGVMAADILLQLADDNQIPEQYYILEVSADLRERQYETIKYRAPELLDRVHWLEQLPESFSAIVLANELFDAMPVTRFCIQNGQAKELFIVESDSGFDWQIGTEAAVRLQEHVREIENSLGTLLPEGYVSEVNFSAEEWLKSLATSMKEGLILLIDYGQSRHSYYHPQRGQGTLQCHYRHRVHDDPFYYPGLQDITAHVDFTAIADAALEVGLQIEGYTTQAHFLLGSGLTELATVSNAAESDPAQLLAQVNEIKRLTLPQEMGETFKVIGLSKNISVNMPGFNMNDMRNRL